MGNALASTAFLAVVTIAALAAEQVSGSVHLAGLPSALGTVGAALGAAALTALSRRSGRRLAFGLGFALSAAGGAIAVGSLWVSSVALLSGAMFVIGFGRSVTQLSRFAAGDLWPAERRASAMGLLVWSATVSAVAGPLMILPASRFGIDHLGVELAGPYAIGGCIFALASLWYFLTLRPDPLSLALDEEEPAVDQEAELPRRGRSLSTLLRHPTVQLSFLVLATTQFVMILVMTMTPLHIRGHHHGLSLVSGVMMAHTLGMYGIAPLTGYLVDRFGARRMAAAGSLLLVSSSLLSATAGEAEATTLTVSLFLLGVGWNFGFVAGSSVLQENLGLDDRLRVQGPADSLTWISGGVGALASGFIVSAWSFSGLSIFGAAIALLPLAGLMVEAAKRAETGCRKTA